MLIRIYSQLREMLRSPFLECADVSTTARLPHWGPDLSALWSARSVAADCVLSGSLTASGVRSPETKALTGQRTPKVFFGPLQPGAGLKKGSPEGLVFLQSDACTLRLQSSCLLTCSPRKPRLSPLEKRIRKAVLLAP